MATAARCDVCIPANCDDRCEFVTVPDWDRPDDEMSKGEIESVMDQISGFSGAVGGPACDDQTGVVPRA